MSTDKTIHIPEELQSLLINPNITITGKWQDDKISYTDYEEIIKPLDEWISKLRVLREIKFSVLLENGNCGKIVCRIIAGKERLTIPGNLKNIAISMHYVPTSEIGIKIANPDSLYLDNRKDAVNIRTLLIQGIIYMDPKLCTILEKQVSEEIKYIMHNIETGVQLIQTIYVDAIYTLNIENAYRLIEKHYELIGNKLEYNIRTRLENKLGKIVKVGRYRDPYDTKIDTEKMLYTFLQDMITLIERLDTK